MFNKGDQRKYNPLENYVGPDNPLNKNYNPLKAKETFFRFFVDNQDVLPYNHGIS